MTGASPPSAPPEVAAPRPWLTRGVYRGEDGYFIMLGASKRLAFVSAHTLGRAVDERDPMILR